MTVLLALGALLLMLAAVLVAMNLYFLSLGSVPGLINDRLRPIRQVTYTLRDSPDDFYAAITLNLLFCAGMAMVGLTLLWYAMRLIRQRPTRPNGEPWWFI